MSTLLLAGLILAVVGLIVWLGTPEKVVGMSMTTVGVVLALATVISERL